MLLHQEDKQIEIELAYKHFSHILEYPRPQDSESTASRSICAVNQSAAQLVPRWGTTRESWVPWFSFNYFPFWARRLQLTLTLTGLTRDLLLSEKSVVQ